MTPTETTLYHLHCHARTEGIRLAYARTATAAPPMDERRALANSAEREAIVRLLLDGYTVHRMPHNARYDVLLDYRVRCEVKCSRWTPSARRNRGRFQMCYHNAADVVLWLLANTGTWFVLPVAALGNRRNVAIFTRTPDAIRDYTGQWAQYRGAWPVLAELVHQARADGRAIPYQARFL